MDSVDFLAWEVLADIVLIPLCALLAGGLLGGMVNHRLKALSASGRFAEDSFIGVLLHSLRHLPIVWGLQLGAKWALVAAPIPDQVERAGIHLLFVVFIWSVATFLQRVFCQVIELRMASDGSPASTSLLLDLVSALVYTIGVIIILEAFGISITPIVTALGIGGMAVALGLQETMANIFAGLHILLTKQVRIGDHIRLEGGSEGQIIDITWRYAKIHTVVTNNIIIVPNSTLASSIITNYDMAPDGTQVISIEDVAFTVSAGVAYDSDLEKVERVTLEVAREVLGRLDPRLDISEGASTAPSVRFQNFGESAIYFNANLHTTTFRNQYLIRHEFIKALKKRYDEEGIKIPFPIRTVQMEREKE